MANNCVDRILNTLDQYNSKLREVIQECKKSKNALRSPKKRFGALEKCIDPQNPEEKLRKVLSPKVDKLEFQMKIQMEMELLIRGTEGP
eukprot:CAMPEP_0202427540 /NCGR_PEP_ID=MMETSP1345-20130828/1742_1 /ASSEMBLY_ACC=CAM_ASM_000843 /TAXON_ID=342563 /ORGANISM="Fabrea Fabrea salina" /LENGTH=88 /DNA_ID=CAMNT_0049038281 /DNA_START=161 /DNA_END=424 /DNA_ORIENTATION=+